MWCPLLLVVVGPEPPKPPPPVGLTFEVLATPPQDALVEGERGTDVADAAQDQENVNGQWQDKSTPNSFWNVPPANSSTPMNLADNSASDTQWPRKGARFQETVTTIPQSPPPPYSVIVAQGINESIAEVSDEEEEPEEQPDEQDEEAEQIELTRRDPHHFRIEDRKQPRLDAQPVRGVLKKPLRTRESSTTSSDDDTVYRDSEDEDDLARKVNRNASLARFLERRPLVNELEQRNILPAQSVSERDAVRDQLAATLVRRLSARPSVNELADRNILRPEGESDAERRLRFEERKKMLVRKLTVRPTVDELRELGIVQFADHIEVTEVEFVDRAGDKPWTRLTPSVKAEIRKELNDFKEYEMNVHEDSRKYTRFHKP